MAREKDESKREAILAAAKRLFAERGFKGASVSDIVEPLGMPVGSVYTYFENKDDILSSLIEEGWAEFEAGLEEAVRAEADPARRLSLVVKRFLPELLRDEELVTLILIEAPRVTDLGAKLERLATLIAGLVVDAAASKGVAIDFPPLQAAAALSVFFLGSLDTMRLSRRVGLPVGEAEVLGFIEMAIKSSFGLELPDV
ncbi:MAG TPA: TetR/AcrR family transcriptional regulator [Spirochaetales bacterium]|nr:TetR/AcrR family transcriptional regulator [Spirochaetales bacterium]